MHMEIKAAMFNYVTYDKSHGQPNIFFFRTHFFHTQSFAPIFLFLPKWKKSLGSDREKGRVKSPEPDIFFYFIKPT